MTNQEVFDRVVTHALSQMEKSIESGFVTCFYRGPKGLKCFLGALIPDEIYEAEMEGNGYRDLSMLYPKVKALFKGSDFELIRDLQIVHDDNEPELWRYELSKIARNWDLSTKALEEVVKND